MRATWLCVLGITACADPTPAVGVVARRDNAPAVAATVIAHRVDGTRLAATVTDADGRATIVVEPDALISVAFAAGHAVTVVTTAQPPAGVDLVVRGPRDVSEPVAIGSLQIEPVQPLAADYFDVALGCARTVVGSMPAVVDVPRACLGSDTMLDVLVIGYRLVGEDVPAQTVGYAAGRVELVNGTARIAFPAWETTQPIVRIEQNGTDAWFEVTSWVDGLPFTSAAFPDHGDVWSNLAADRTTVRGRIIDPTRARVTDKALAGVPTTVAFTADDFLREIPQLVTLRDRARLVLAWQPLAIAADAVNIRVDWTAGVQTVTWDVALPPDAIGVTFPRFPEAFPMPRGGALSATLSYIDTSELDGWASVAAAGIDASGGSRELSPIVPAPTIGALRTTMRVTDF